MDIDSSKFVSAKKTDGKYLNQFDITYFTIAGQERVWTISSRADVPKCITGEFDMPDAVVIVPYYWPKNSLVLTREYRVAIADYEYGFPAGLIDTDESIEKAAERELFEETGLTLTRVNKVSPPIYSSPGMTDEAVSLVYVDCEGAPSNKYNEDSEMIETLLLSLSDIERLLRNKSLKFGAKAWIILDGFIQKGRLI